MNKSCTIRTATPADLETISSIESICFAPAEAADQSRFYDRLERFADHFWLCETEGKVVGFIDGAVINTRTISDEMYADASYHDPKGMWQAVYGINVLPQFRGQGIGHKLMHALIAAARSQGRQGCVLTCKDHMIGWYEKQGFRLLGRSASVHGGMVWNDMVLEFSEQNGNRQK